MEEPEPEPEPEPEAAASRHLRRRNSIATSVPKLSLPKHLQTSNSLPLNGTSSSSPPQIDLELISLKSPTTLSYTSLKDLLPPLAVNSPTTATAASNSGYEISIRNRLVKQAAWAYLQPMSSSPDSSGPHFLRRLCLRFSACIRPIVPVITRLFHRILQIFRVPVSR